MLTVFQILFCHIYTLWRLVVSLVFAIRVVISDSDIQTKFSVLFILNMMSMLEFIAHVLSLIYRCEQVYEQRNDVISILDHIILVDKNIKPSKRSSLVEFRSLVHSRPIQFTAANFYRLEFRLLVAFCSVVVTYTIIIMQNQSNDMRSE
ncbi:hypothetical protein ABMA27_005793 [Loxostege sticticalis]|uniref:Gustatory receptor n=1 Tax=Loxostege sticticalis TaxID=481309 RepID=A0ABR3HGH9_LOXSC